MQPEITKSSDLEWKQYYEQQYKEADKQIKDIISFIPLLIDFGMKCDTEKLLIAARLLEHALKYPRDKEVLKEVISRHEIKRS